MNRKKIEILEAYIDGIISLAKEQAHNLKRSDISIELYWKDDYKDKLFKNHHIEEIPVRELEQTLNAALNDWFFNNDIVTCIVKLLEKEMDPAKKIYTTQWGIDLDTLFDKNKPFYNIEDLLMIEFSEYILVIVLGNEK